MRYANHGSRYILLHIVIKLDVILVSWPPFRVFALEFPSMNRLSLPAGPASSTQPPLNKQATVFQPSFSPSLTQLSEPASAFLSLKAKSGPTWECTGDVINMLRLLIIIAAIVALRWSMFSSANRSGQKGQLSHTTSSSPLNSVLYSMSFLARRYIVPTGDVCTPPFHNLQIVGIATLLTCVGFSEHI